MIPLQNSQICTPSRGNNIKIIALYTPQLCMPVSAISKWGSEAAALVQGLLSATSTLQRLEWLE